MRNSIWILLAVLIVTVCAPHANADTITTFDVSGTAFARAGQSCGMSCSFSGTLTVDVTSGAVTAADITFPGLASFTGLSNAGLPVGSNWSFFLNNGSAGDQLTFVSTTSTPGSLVGFNGGPIFTGNVDSNLLYSIVGGSITAPTATPEPSSLFLMLIGLGALAFTMSRRRLNHAHSAGHSV